MRIKSQSNGINISALINTDELEKSILAPYKAKIRVLESQVKKRNNYIKNMHFQVRRKKWMIYIGYISTQLMRPLPAKLTSKRILLLFYMYEREFTNIPKVQKDMKELGLPHSTMSVDFKYFKEAGLVNADQRGFYYLLDKGREIVEYYEKNMKIRFAHMAKIKQDISNIKERDEVIKESKYSEEEKKKRKLMYLKLMKPFWEMGMKRIPKDKAKRIDMLVGWMKANNIKDEWYTKLIFNWGSK